MRKSLFIPTPVCASATGDLLAILLGVSALLGWLPVDLRALGLVPLLCFAGHE